MKKKKRKKLTSNCCKKWKRIVSSLQARNFPSPPPNPVWNQIWQRARKPKGENGGKKNKINGIKVELNAGKGFEIEGARRVNLFFFFFFDPSVADPRWRINIFTISRSLTTLKSRATRRLIDTKRGEVPLTDSFPSVQGLNAEQRWIFHGFRSISPPLYSLSFSLSLSLARSTRTAVESSLLLNIQ